LPGGIITGEVTGGTVNPGFIAGKVVVVTNGIVGVVLALYH